MVTLNDNQVTRINNKEYNNLLENNMDILTKTSGTPTNWEYEDNNNIKTIGLKSNNNHQISYQKILKLKENKQLMDKYFPSGVSYEITLYPKNNPNNKMLIAGTQLTNKKQVLSKSQIVFIDYGYKITQFNKERKTDTCYYNHDSNWTCKAFTITKTLLNEGEYYIITNTSTEYILSNTYSENITDTNNGITKINNKLQQLLKNDNETIYIHINTKNNNTYIAYDNNNQQEHLNKIIKPETQILNIKIAT